MSASITRSMTLGKQFGTFYASVSPICKAGTIVVLSLRFAVKGK